ncbi:hypothetical protein EDB85DRAFT_218383 [Lactarius pseudohatsudake]|nr:hypothetical protein EDB85DRAFT_218383 [Lactarius pseudohatsudake]
MSFLLLPICYFLQNGMSPDDLGLILAGGAVLILMIRVTCRAMRVVSAHLMTPTAGLYLYMLVGGALDLEAGGLAEVEDPIDRDSDDLATVPET